MYSFHFPETKGEMKLYITGCIRIVREFVMIVKTVFFITHAQGLMPAKSLFFPVIVPLHFFSGLDEELHLHLFKFTHSENKLPGNDLIPESLACLCNAK